MAIINQLPCNNNEVLFTFFDDLKSKDGFTNDGKILSFETR